jgi:hypothetical protein
MRSTIYALSVAAMATTFSSHAIADAYGRWVAIVPPKPYCSSSRLTLDVRGGYIAGNVVNSEGVFPVAGEIDLTGNGTIRIGQVAGIIHFGMNRFVADYPNFKCGLRHAVGFRID